MSAIFCLLLKKHPYCNVFTFFCVYIDKDRVVCAKKTISETTKKKASFLRMKFKDNIIFHKFQMLFKENRYLCIVESKTSV